MVTVLQINLQNVFLHNICIRTELQLDVNNYQLYVHAVSVILLAVCDTVMQMLLVWNTEKLKK